MEDKNELRKKIRSMLKTIAPKEWISKSHKLCAQFLGNDAKLTQIFNDADVIFFFMPLASEADITPLIIQAIKQNKECYLPRVDDGQNSETMTFYKLDNSVLLSEQLENGSYGIREPKTTLPKFNYDSSFNSDIIVIVPGLAFDKNYDRLGKGKGYYDRFFEKYDKLNMTKVAICFECQLLESIPHDEHDKKVDIIVTENSVLSN